MWKLSSLAKLIWKKEKSQGAADDWPALLRVSSLRIGFTKAEGFICFHIAANSTEFSGLFVLRQCCCKTSPTHPQWLGPQSLLQYSLSHSGFWPCTGLGAPGDWDPPTLFWYSAWIWENPCRVIVEEQEEEELISGQHSVWDKVALLVKQTNKKIHSSLSN